MGLAKLYIAFTMTGLFAIVLITFVVNFSNENSASFALDSDVSNLPSEVEGTLTTFNSDVNSTSKSIFKSETVGETLQTGGVLEKPTESSFAGVKKVLTSGFKSVFGDDDSSGGFYIVLTTLGGTLTMLVGLYVLKMWLGRNPD